MGPEDVLPLSEHLHAVPPGWPVQPASTSALVEITGAGRMLDGLRRQANALAYSHDDWGATLQPVGYLYRAESVNAVQSWLKGLNELVEANETLRQLEYLGEIVDHAVETATPFLRLYEYAAEVPDSIAIIVTARKEYVFWDTETVPGSSETLANMSGLWALGPMLDSSVRTQQSGPTIGESTESRRARIYERSIRAGDSLGDSEQRHVEKLDLLLSTEAQSAPIPSAADVLLSQAAILWRPRRLELVDVQRLSRWLRHHTNDSRHCETLAEVIAFIESANRERANILLDAFCTDSPEAL